MKFRCPVQADAVYQRFYDNAVTNTWPAQGDRPDWDLISGYIGGLLPHGGRVLDCGCYTGGLLARLGPRYRRYGVEVNRAAAAVASHSIGGIVWASIGEVPREHRFDAIIAADVVEHVTNPLAFIQTLASRLSSGGVLLITTGDADNFLWNRFGANWWYCFYPEHITFISEAWIHNVSKLVGVSVDCCETFRYRDLGGLRRFAHAVLTVCYGWFPGSYLALGGLLKRLLGRGKTAGVPAAGLSRDHLFIVLRKLDAS